MDRGTFGQLWIERALPGPLRGRKRVLNKDGLLALAEELAQQGPDVYRDTLKALNDIGRSTALASGSYSFGLAHLLPSEHWQERRGRLEAQVERILESGLTQEQKEQRIVAAGHNAQQGLADAVYREALAKKNPLALQVLSGSRGKPSNLMSLLASDVLYTDAQDNVIPIPILNSYSQGLSPAEYFASAFGGRKGVVDVKLGTANAGYYSKLLGQAAHRLLVTQLDADPEHDAVYRKRGLPVRTLDPDNAGALLSFAAAGYPRNTVLTPAVLNDLARQGHDEIVVRSPLVGGPPAGGVYARDVGVRERGRLAPLGDFVGIAAAQAISEPVNQGTLSSKHGGGVAGSNKVSGFKLLSQYVNVPQTFPGGATHAQLDGKVSRIEAAPAGGKYLWVGPERHFVPRDAGLLVKTGDTVEAGDPLSDGLPNPQELVKHKGLGEGRRRYLHLYGQALRDSGIGHDRRNLELVTRGLLNHVELDEELGPYVPGDLLPYDMLEAEWQPREGSQSLPLKKAVGQYLEEPALHHTLGTRIQPSMLPTLERHGVKSLLVHAEPPPFRPVMIRAMENLQHDPDWVTRMLGSGLEKTTLKAVHRGAASTPHDTSFVSALTDPHSFGRQGPIRGFAADPVKAARVPVHQFGQFSPYSSAVPQAAQQAGNPGGPLQHPPMPAGRLHEPAPRAGGPSPAPAAPQPPGPPQQGGGLFGNLGQMLPNIWRSVGGQLAPHIAPMVGGVPGLLGLHDLVTTGGERMRTLFTPDTAGGPWAVPPPGGSSAPAAAPPAAPAAPPVQPPPAAPSAPSPSPLPGQPPASEPAPAAPPAWSPFRPQLPATYQAPGSQGGAQPWQAPGGLTTPPSASLPAPVRAPIDFNAQHFEMPQPGVRDYGGQAVNVVAPGGLGQSLSQPGNHLGTLAHLAATLGRLPGRVDSVLGPLGLTSPSPQDSAWFRTHDEQNRPYLAPVWVRGEDGVSRWEMRSAPQPGFNPQALSPERISARLRGMSGSAAPAPGTDPNAFSVGGLVGNQNAGQREAYEAYAQQAGAQTAPPPSWTGLLPLATRLGYQTAVPPRYVSDDPAVQTRLDELRSGAYPNLLGNVPVLPDGPAQQALHHAGRFGTTAMSLLAPSLLLGPGALPFAAGAMVAPHVNDAGSAVGGALQAHPPTYGMGLERSARSVPAWANEGLTGADVLGSPATQALAQAAYAGVRHGRQLATPPGTHIGRPSVPLEPRHLRGLQSLNPYTQLDTLPEVAISGWQSALQRARAEREYRGQDPVGGPAPTASALDRRAEEFDRNVVQQQESPAALWGRATGPGGWLHLPGPVAEAASGRHQGVRTPDVERATGRDRVPGFASLPGAEHLTPADLAQLGLDPDFAAGLPPERRLANYIHAYVGGGTQPAPTAQGAQPSVPAYTTPEQQRQQAQSRADFFHQVQQRISQRRPSP